MSEQTVNLPQLVIVILVGVFAIRYLFFSGSNTASGSGRNSSANNLRAREADVERIQQMFPQVSRRSIMWDLQRNGGNVVATTERILSGRGLENVSCLL
jgi:coupling of ubiquitin conjugation to ER degradation protein 1